MSHKFNIYRSIFLLILGACAVVTPSLAQDQGDDSSRRFWPPNYRPAPAQKKAAPKTGRYKRATPALSQETALVDAVVGITIWRLRQTKQTDEARILVTKNGQKSNWTPERVEAKTKFTEGQMLRLSIEVPRTGYLYVINREVYADGTTSDPYLIFPLNPASDENRVTAGRVIEIPNQSGDDQAYFEVKSLRHASQSPHVAEALTVFVTTTPLKELPKRGAADGSPMQLPKSLVEKWEKEWDAPVEQLELENGAGAAYTRAEQAAGKDPSKLLTQEDPLPQTIFRVAPKPDKPLMIKLPLMIGK